MIPLECQRECRVAIFVVKLSNNPRSPRFPEAPRFSVAQNIIAISSFMTIFRKLNSAKPLFSECCENRDSDEITAIMFKPRNDPFSFHMSSSSCFSITVSFHMSSTSCFSITNFFFVLVSRSEIIKIVVFFVFVHFIN
eukprot:m.202988 g.202988  ORF g.202988 m.202988 type:complete len:138 (-) comp32842_c5_seq4:612-1025(-)